MISVTLYTLMALSFDRMRSVRGYCGQPVTERSCLSPTQAGHRDARSLTAPPTIVAVPDCSVMPLAGSLVSRS
jgi:hypothetical protein